MELSAPARHTLFHRRTEIPAAPLDYVRKEGGYGAGGGCGMVP